MFLSHMVCMGLEFNGSKWSPLLPQAPVVQRAERVDNAIHRLNYYPVDSLVCFSNTYPLHSDLSGG